MKELGGDEEDFKLLLSVESTKKQEEQQPEESSFTDTDQQELKNLMKSLNLSKFASVSVVPDAAEGEVKEKKDKKVDTKVEKKAKEKQKKLQDSEVSSTTTSPAVPAAVQAVEEEPSRSGPEFHFVKTTPNRGHCVIRQSESKWYSSATEPAAAKAETNGSEEVEVNLKYWLPKIEKYAQLAWDLELKNYEEARKKGL